MNEVKKDLINLDVKEIDDILESVNNQLAVLVDQKRAVDASLERMYRAKEVFLALRDIKRDKLLSPIFPQSKCCSCSPPERRDALIESLTEGFIFHLTSSRVLLFL